MQHIAANIDDEKDYTDTSKALRNHHFKKTETNNKYVRQLYLDINGSQSAGLEK